MKGVSKAHQHQKAIDYLLTRLGLLGIKATRADPADRPCDIVIDDRIRCGVSTARARLRTWRVKVGGRDYAYTYDCAQWNVLRRSRNVRRLLPLHIWLLLELRSGDVYVTPRRVVGRSRYILFPVDKPLARSPVLRFRNRFDLLQRNAMMEA